MPITKPQQLRGTRGQMKARAYELGNVLKKKKMKESSGEGVRERGSVAGGRGWEGVGDKMKQKLLT